MTSLVTSAARPSAMIPYPENSAGVPHNVPSAGLDGAGSAV